MSATYTSIPTLSLPLEEGVRIVASWENEWNYFSLLHRQSEFYFIIQSKNQEQGSPPFNRYHITNIIPQEILLDVKLRIELDLTTDAATTPAG